VGRLQPNEREDMDDEASLLCYNSISTDDIAVVEALETDSEEAGKVASDVFQPVNLEVIDDAIYSSEGSYSSRSTDYETHNHDLVRCELVAISKGAHKTNEKRFSGRGREDGDAAETIRYYNVLWIEWVDGVAYRRGVGLVFEDAWEAQELETINLILG
jgi:hypothetical protein